VSSGHNASETTRSQCIGLFGYSFFTDDCAAAVLTTGTKWGGLLTGRKQEHVKLEDEFTFLPTAWIIRPTNFSGWQNRCFFILKKAACWATLACESAREGFGWVD